MNVYPGMSDAEFEAEIQKEAQRLDEEFKRFVKSGKSYAEFLLEDDIKSFEKTLLQRKKAEEEERKKYLESLTSEKQVSEPARREQRSEKAENKLIQTIDDLLDKLEERKEKIHSERPTEEPPPSSENLKNDLDRLIAQTHKKDKEADPLAFLDEL